jgi:hypothetical protein
MRKKSIPILIGALCLIGSMNLMCFILKVTTISRITCKSMDQAIGQNKLYLLGMFLSFSGAFILTKYFRKKLPKKDDTHYIEADEK